MTMKKLLTSLLLGGLFFCCGAAEQKIAVVDMQKVFTGYDRTKTIELKVNQQMEVYKQYAAGLFQEYQQLNREYLSLRDDSQNLTLSEAERENRRLRAIEKAEQIKKKENELKDYNQSRQKQIKENFEKLRAEVVEEIRTVIRNKCIREGWTLVLDKSGVSLNDLPLVLYHTPETDLTQDILEDLNRVYRSGNQKKAE